MAAVEEELLRFHTHLNQQSPNIQFTMEGETADKIPFLDVLVTRNEHRHSTYMYRKPTHTERYIPYNYHHHLRVLTGVIRCMQNRALQVCDDASKQVEMEHLEEEFQANGFPERLVKRALSCAPSPRGPPREDDDPEEETPKLVCVPYVRGVSES